MSFSSDPVIHSVLLVVCAICAWTDLRRQEIHDWVTVPGFVLGLVLAGALHGGDALISSLVGGALGFGVFGLFWYLGLMASGDVFLMGAAGALLRFPLVLYAMLYASLLGVVVALVWVVVHGQTRRVLSNMSKIVGRLWRRKTDDPDAAVEKTPFPFGIAIGAGAVWAAAMPYFPWIALQVG
jgi:prepilin peptidase CpaA